MANILQAGADTALILKTPNKGWFEENKDILLPEITEKNKLLSEMQSSTEGKDKKYLQKRLRETSKK